MHICKQSRFSAEPLVLDKFCPVEFHATRKEESSSWGPGAFFRFSKKGTTLSLCRIYVKIVLTTARNPRQQGQPLLDMPLTAIMVQTWHKSVQVAKRYVRNAEIWKQNVTEKIFSLTDVALEKETR